MSDADSIVSRLCAACGLCCNGVLFHTVHLKPGDSPKALSALGLKLKKKQGQQYLLQPCPAHRDGSCSIYDHRPTRCRLFECRLCEQIRAGDTIESEAMDQILEAKAQVARLNQRLEQLGNTRTSQPLFKRCDSALAEPPDSPESRARHQTVQQARKDLDSLLEHRFRLPAPQSGGEGEWCGGRDGDSSPPPYPVKRGKRSPRSKWSVAAKHGSS